MIKNEVLPSVLFEFIHRRPDGGEETVYFTIKLTNAFVSNISRFTAKEKELPPELERVALTYGKIEWEHKEAKTMAADTWTDHAGN
jgi:type VI secretion system Hcp family effector